MSIGFDVIDLQTFSFGVKALTKDLAQVSKLEKNHHSYYTLQIFGEHHSSSN